MIVLRKLSAGFSNRGLLRDLAVFTEAGSFRLMADDASIVLFVVFAAEKLFVKM